MNTLFAAKFLQNLRKQQDNKGFTLIELLLVIVILGILVAVALPNFLGQVGKARETEAKNGIGTINRSQQVYHFEKRTFSSVLDNDQLGVQNPLGVILSSDYYTFQINGGSGFSSSEADAIQAENDGVRKYAGAIGYISSSGQYRTFLCQGDIVDDTASPPTPTGVSTGCPAGSIQLK